MNSTDDAIIHTIQHPQSQGKSVERPGRPLGVSLAIIASLMLFTLFPLVLIAMVLLVQQHFQNLDFGGSGIAPVAMGGDFMGVNPVALGLQAVVSLAFLLIAVCAWIGRPSSIRYVMLAAVVLMTLYSLLQTISQTMAQPTVSQGVSSLDALLDSVSCGQFALSALVSLYVVWYLNRGPARAFYRGYFLPDPDETAKPPAESGG
jgi:hypothetical protein